jgi:hypothetical protein
MFTRYWSTHRETLDQFLVENGATLPRFLVKTIARSTPPFQGDGTHRGL